MSLSSERQPAFAGGLGQRFDAAVIQIGAAVEDHVRDAGGQGPFGHQLADAAAASLSAPVRKASRSDLSSEDAAASVTPATSSITWA
jgi:hypothetical protein